MKLKHWLLLVAVLAVAAFGFHKYHKYDSCVKGVANSLSSKLDMKGRLDIGERICKGWFKYEQKIL